MTGPPLGPPSIGVEYERLRDFHRTLTPQPSEFDRDHVEQILGGHGDWFSAHLLRLYAKADDGNRSRLRDAFPYHAAAYDDWFTGRRPSEPLPGEEDV